MSAAEFIEGLKTMPEAEREEVFATLLKNEEWRQDILDLATIAERRNEPARPIDDVLKDIGIDA